MNGCTIAYVITNENFAAAGGHPDDIAGMSPDNNFTAIHGVAAAILGVAVNGDRGAIHERTQVIPRRSMHVNLYRLIQIGANVALPADIIDLNMFGAGIDGGAQTGIQVFKKQSVGIDGY